MVAALSSLEWRPYPANLTTFAAACAAATAASAAAAVATATAIAWLLSPVTGDDPSSSLSLSSLVTSGELSAGKCSNDTTSGASLWHFSTSAFCKLKPLIQQQTLIRNHSEWCQQEAHGDQWGMMWWHSWLDNNVSWALHVLIWDHALYALIKE